VIDYFETMAAMLEEKLIATVSIPTNLFTDNKHSETSCLP